MSIPRFVALCGAPESGKSTVAKMLVDRYRAEFVDDGEGLREMCMAFFGMSWEDCYTQEGKARTREVNGKTYTNRKILGDTGKLLEGYFGQNVIPEMALAKLEARRPVSPAPFFVFASVRMKQGQAYLARGGIVVEIVRPGYEPVNDFDHYDKSLVTHQLFNNTTLEDLRHQARVMFDQMTGGF